MHVTYLQLSKRTQHGLVLYLRGNADQSLTQNHSVVSPVLTHPKSSAAYQGQDATSQALARDLNSCPFLAYRYTSLKHIAQTVWTCHVEVQLFIWLQAATAEIVLFFFFLIYLSLSMHVVYICGLLLQHVILVKLPVFIKYHSQTDG